MTGRELDGLVAGVTGGGSGIGLATAMVLTARGAAVACRDLDPSGAPSPLLGIPADDTDQASVDEAGEAVVGRRGGLDILVNNAGIGAQGTVETNPIDEWHRVLDVNVLGIVRCIRAALPQRALYSASKGAVPSLTLAMAADHLAEGIRVNCLNPGTADTPWVGRLLAGAADPMAERSALEARQPMGRLVSAAEVAESIAYLASPARRLHHGHGPARRRWHGGPARPPPHLTCPPEPSSSKGDQR